MQVLFVIFLKKFLVSLLFIGFTHNLSVFHPDIKASAAPFIHARGGGFPRVSLEPKKKPPPLSRTTSSSGFRSKRKPPRKILGGIFGTRSGVRTLDTLIKSQVLYQLS